MHILFIIIVMDTKTQQQPSTFVRGFGTRAIHTAQNPDPTTGAVVLPISMCSTFEAGTSGSFSYSRSANPTRDALEKVMCALEKAAHTFVLPSGNGAGSLITHLLKPGDQILASQDMYGGLIGYFNNLATPVMKFEVKYADFRNRAEMLASFTDRTRLVWMESPTNPLLNIYDIRDMVSICKSKGALLVFDNTFYSPYLMNPLDFGADIVMHSGTKYIGGHSDILMGFICTNNEELYKRFNTLYAQYGACPSPFDCYLALRGLKTLAVRMKRAQSNAQRLAEFLFKQSQIEQVFYPGLPSHPGYELNKKQARGTGAMLSFRLKGANLDTATKFCKAMHIFAYAGSLGGVEGLICTPTTFTHATASPEFKKKVGVTENLIRVSVGIEDYQDLENDFAGAFKTIA